MKNRNRILIASAVIFFLLLIDAFSIYGLQALDQTALDYMTSLGSESTNEIMIQITNLSGKIAILIFSVSLVIILSALKKWDALSFSMMSLVGCIFFSLFFKSIVGRLRPTTKLFDPGEYSFPSGHAAMAMCMALIMYYLIKTSLINRIYKVFLLFVMLFPLLISFTRVYLHVHYLSDVIGGMSLSLVWVLLMSNIYLPNELSKTRQV